MIPVDREGEGYAEIHQFPKMNSVRAPFIISNLEVPENGDHAVSGYCRGSSEIALAFLASPAFTDTAYGIDFFLAGSVTSGFTLLTYVSGG